MAQIEGTVLDANAEDTDALLVKATNMNIKQYVETKRRGKYDDEVQTLIQVNEQTGYRNSIEILVPTRDDVAKYRKAFADSAANFEKSTMLVNGKDGVSQGDGAGVILEFVLTEKKRGRQKIVQEVAQGNDDAPVPA